MWLFLGRPRQKRSFSNILDRKENFSEQESEVSKTSEKSNFSSPWFLSKNWAFYHVCFLATQGRKDRFLLFWIEKNTFKTSFKNVRKIEFFKGVSPCFLSEIELFTMWVFLGKPRQKRPFFNILDRKE